MAGYTWNTLPANITPEVRGYRTIPVFEDGVVRNQSVNEIDRLGSGTLAPGEKVSGWVGFPISLSTMATRIPERPALTWMLHVPLGDDELQIDLLKKETEAIVIRPPTANSEVSVLEIGPKRQHGELREA